MAGVTATAITRACLTVLKPAIVGRRIDAAHPAAVEYLRLRADPETLGAATGLDPLYEHAVAHCRESGNFTISAVSRGLSIGYARASRIFATMTATGVAQPAAPAKAGQVVPPGPAKPTPAAARPTPAPPPPRILGGTEKKRQTKKQEALARHTTSPTSPAETGSTLHEIPDDIKKFADMTLRELIQRYGTDVAFLDWLKATKQIEDINEKRLKNATTKGELVSRELVKIGVIDQINAAHTKLLTDGAKTIALRVVAMSKAGRAVDECEKFIVDQIGSFIKPAKVKMARALKNA